MNKIFVLFYILISGTLYAQVQKNPVLIEDTTVYSITDSKPSFPGGNSKMNKFIYSNLNYKEYLKMMFSVRFMCNLLWRKMAVFPI